MDVIDTQTSLTDTEPIIGIDLGTTNSCMGYFNKKTKKIELIPLIDTSPLYPSKVTMDNTEFYNVKRFIGKTDIDDFVNSETLFMPYEISTFNDSIILSSGKKNYLPDDISSYVLSDMKKRAEKYLGSQIKNIVITVPAHFNDNQKKSTINACAKANLNVIGVISEPTAAALTYCIAHDYENIDNSLKKILVFDLGGGTLDISLLKTNGREKFDVLNTIGNVNLGGEDFTNETVLCCIKSFMKVNNIIGSEYDIVYESKQSVGLLKKKIEEAKKLLPKQTNIHIKNFYDSTDLLIEITEEFFNNACDKLFCRCIELITEIINYSGVDKKEIEEIILVGGATRMNKLNQLIGKYFGKKPKCDIDPDEAIAYGATVYFATLSGYSQYLKNINVHDVTPLTISIKTAGGILIPLIDKNTKIPCTGSKIFKTANKTQHSVLIQIYQDSKDEKFKLGECRMENIVGETKIEIIISVDKNNILYMIAKNLSSGKIIKSTFNNLSLNMLKK